MDTVYPPAASALARGRRLRGHDARARHRTAPVTFAEITEVDEEKEGVGSEASLERRRRPDVLEVGSEASLERRRRPDLLEERLGRQFAEFRRRRAKLALRELSPPPPAGSPPPPASSPPPPAGSPPPGVARAASEPAALHRPPGTPAPTASHT